MCAADHDSERARRVKSVRLEEVRDGARSKLQKELMDEKRGWKKRYAKRRRCHSAAFNAAEHSVPSSRECLDRCSCGVRLDRFRVRWL